VPVIKLLNEFIFRYRTSTTRKNLIISFPNKTKEQIDKIYGKFFMNFFQTIFEIIKVLNFKKTELKKRVQINNINIIKESYKRNKSVVLICGHYNNFEWLGLRLSLENINFTAIYKPLHNTYLDRVILAIRTKFGAKLLPFNKLKQFILKNKKKKFTISFVADQVPADIKNGIRFNFLNQSTLFHKGPEKISKILNAETFYVEMNKIKNGYYVAHFEKIDSKNITSIFAKKLEKSIQKEPHAWLWSHKRWKR
tara:strand:+ start:2816 stop:3571 length:756 start_codon:yes stop_codon:yes gene_type:complete